MKNDTQGTDTVTLELQDVDSFYGELQVLRKASLTVRRGEVVALFGPNGHGKSTLMKVIAGLHPPKAGSIRLNNHEIGGLNSDKIVEMGVALIPEGRHLFPEMSVMENLTMGAFNRSARKQMQTNFDVVFGLFPRLKERMNQLAATLSGGESRMLAVGRGMMSNASLLLFNTALKKMMENPKWDTACIFFLIGVGMVLENGILQIFGPRIKSIPRFLDGRLKWGYLRINWHDVALIIIVIAAFIVISYLLKKTWPGMERIHAYYLIFAVFLVILVIIHRIVHSNTGLAFQAMRDDEELALSLGVNLYFEKIKVFAVCSFFTGVMGGVYVHYLSSISPATNSLESFMLAMCMIFLGGLGRFPGAVIGALFLTFTNEFLQLTGTLRPLLIGGIICVLILYLPKGFMQIVDWIDRKIGKRSSNSPMKPGAVLTGIILKNFTLKQ